ncbi:hypothetical protein ACLOJK_014571, partial [Asimina triloba]
MGEIHPATNKVQRDGYSIQVENPAANNNFTWLNHIRPRGSNQPPNNSNFMAFMGVNAAEFSNIIKATTWGSPVRAKEKGGLGGSKWEGRLVVEHLNKAMLASG